MGVSGRSRGRGGTQHIASSVAEYTATYCVMGPLRAGGVRRDPEQHLFGSQERKREIIAG